MACGSYAFTVANNESLIFSLKVSQGGIARDLTGYTVAMEARDSSKEKIVVIDFSDYMAITANTGTIDINVPADVIADIPCGGYSYDVLLIQTSTTDTRRILSGSLQIINGVTQ